MTRAAFFDMDRTLVRAHTGRLYLRWRLARGEMSKREALRGAVWLAQYRLGVADASAILGQALRSVVGMEEQRLEVDCQLWYTEMVKEQVSEAARSEVTRCQSEGTLCVILSASTTYAVAPLAKDLGIDHLLCTQLEVQEGRFTGAYSEPLCYGAGKVKLAERWSVEHGVNLEQCSFYSDSVSDLPMLERVGEPRVVNPDLRLRLSAAKRGWPVERWT